MSVRVCNVVQSQRLKIQAKHTNCSKTQNSSSMSSPVHTVNFDWFLSGLEWVLNLEFCYLKLLIFIRNNYGISYLGLNFPHFEFLSLYLVVLVFRYIWSKIFFCVCKKLLFWSNISKHTLKNSKCGRVKPKSDIL